MKLVEIRWHDSLDWDIGSQWAEVAWVREQPIPDYMKSVGYLLKEDDIYYWLVQSRHLTGDGKDKVGRPYLIPKGCVISFREVPDVESPP